MSTTRRQLLQGAAGLLGATALAPRAVAMGSGSQRLIVVGALGGWDVSYALDPKPDSPLVDGPELDTDSDADPSDTEVLASFSGIDLTTNAARRPAVTTFFDRWASRSTVVRGLWVGSISHEACRVRILTGGPTETAPDVGAMAGSVLGTDAALPYVDLGGIALTGELAALSGSVGRHRQLRYLLDRSLKLDAADGVGIARYPQYRPHAGDQDAISGWLDARQQAYDAAWRGRPGADRRLDDLTLARRRATDLTAEGAGLAAALGRGDATTLEGQLDLAVDLLDSGIARAVTVDSALAWDTHDDNAEQHGLHDTLFARLDELLTRLDATGDLDTTTVLVVSEMTRTPRRNEAGGKDHWPVTSALVLGGPFLGGRVVGATNEALDALPVDFATGLADPSGEVLRYDHFVAAVLDGLGVDPAPWFGDLRRYRGLTA